jgi:hypothetical protein
MKSKTAPGEAATRYASPDGRVVFVLKTTSTGVWIGRQERRSEAEGEGFAIFEALFTSRESFERFRDVDPFRFEHPLLYDLVYREFHRLFGLRAV